MGLWADFSRAKDYDNLTFMEREKARKEYLELAQKEGYDPSEAKAFIAEQGALSQELNADTPEGLEYRKKKAREIAEKKGLDEMEKRDIEFRTLIVDMAIPEDLKSPERVAAEQVTASAYEKPIEQLKAEAEQEYTDPNPLNVGLSTSYLGTRNIKNLTPEKQEAVKRAMERQQQAYQTKLEGQTTAGEVGSRLVEGVGGMIGSPSTYATAPLGAALGAAKIASPLITGALYGGLSGIEEEGAKGNVGQETNYFTGTLKGMAKGLAGGKAMKVLSSPAVRAVSPYVGQTGQAVVGKAAGALGYSGGVTSAETVVSMVNKVRGEDPRSVKDILGDAGVGMIVGTANGLVPSLSDNNIGKLAKRHNESPEFMKAVADSYRRVQRVKAEKSMEYGENPDIKPIKEVLRELDDVFKSSEDATRRDEAGGLTSKKDKAKRSFLAMGTAFVDDQFRNLSKAAEWTRIEKADMLSDYIKSRPDVDPKFAKNEFENLYNQGKIASPASAVFSRLLKLAPTYQQTAIGDANNILSDIYKGANRDESELLNRYLTAKNQISILDRVRKRQAAIDEGQIELPGMEAEAKEIEMLKRSLPKNMSEEKLLRQIELVEKNPEYNHIQERAQKVWSVMKDIPLKDFESGLISEAEFNALDGVENYIPIRHKAEPSPFRPKDMLKKLFVEDADPYAFIKEGVHGDIDMDAGKLVHNAIVRSEMNRTKHEMLGALKELASTEKFGMRVSDTPVKTPGMDSIKYMDAGQEKFIVVPDWFKATLERNGIDRTNMMINVLGVLTGVTPMKKFTVQWNPEFAEGNFFRDFGRYYRLLAIAGDPNASLAQKFLIDNNPAVYAAQMTKNVGEVSSNFSEWKSMAQRDGALRGKMSMEHEGAIYGNKSIGKKTLSAMDQTLGFLGSASEDVMRIAAYKTLIDKGFTPARAGEAVGEFLDYNRRGVATPIMDNVMAFFNVAIQAPRADIRVAKARPADYAMRVTWQVLGAAMLSGIAYTASEGEAEEQTHARDRANTFRMPLGQNTDGSWKRLMIPLDQQDRAPFAIGDALARAYLGKPIDTERLRIALKDYSMPIQPSFNTLTPPTGKALAAIHGVNENLYTGQQLSYVPEPTPANRYAAYDPNRDSAAMVQVTKLLNDISGGEINIQPAMLSEAIRQIIPAGFLSNAVSFTQSALTDEANLNKAPMIRKLIRYSDPELPRRKMMEEGENIKNRQKIENYIQKKKMDKIQGLPEYQKAMMQRIREEKNPFEKQRLANEFKEGYKNRFLGVEAGTKNYLLNYVDPSKFEEIDARYRATHAGKSLMDDPSFRLAVFKQRAWGEDEDDNSEQ